MGETERHWEIIIVSGFSSNKYVSDTLSKMAVALPPMRSLRDFLTDAQFSFSTFNNMDRVNNRIIKNLIYYQTNYILTVIVIFLLVG